MIDNWTLDALLSLCVAAAWAASWGVLSKRGAPDTRHYPGFIAAASGSALVLAGLVAEGLTARVGKLVLLDGLVLISGLVLSHALARSALRRQPRRASQPVRRRD
jgi:hypothetical protein